MKKLTSAETKAYRLSRNFRLSEFCDHPQARAQGIYNVPDEDEIIKLKVLCRRLLQPIRDHFGLPVHILRGFVSQPLAEILDISPKSQHLDCFAADFRIPGVNNQTVISWIAKNLEYDLIMQEGNHPWIHISFVKNNNRRCDLTSIDGRWKYKLSRSFALQELVRSNTAQRLKIYNVPDEYGIYKLQKLCENILQPVRDHFGLPMKVSSGYRSPILNRAIPNASITSQHKRCEAADFEINGVSNYELADWIRENLDFDQLILEHHHPENGPNDGWIHCSFTTLRRNRHQCLRIGKDGTFSGLGKS